MRDKSITWEVDTESHECPVACITAESQRLVDRFFQARSVKKLGGVVYGPDASEWPARWFDTVSLLQSELDKEKSAARVAAHQ